MKFKHMQTKRLTDKINSLGGEIKGYKIDGTRKFFKGDAFVGILFKLHNIDYLISYDIDTSSYYLINNTINNDIEYKGDYKGIKKCLEMI